MATLEALKELLTQKIWDQTGRTALEVALKKPPNANNRFDVLGYYLTEEQRDSFKSGDLKAALQVIDVIQSLPYSALDNKFVEDFIWKGSLYAAACGRGYASPVTRLSLVVTKPSPPLIPRPLVALNNTNDVLLEIKKMYDSVPKKPAHDAALNSLVTIRNKIYPGNSTNPSKPANGSELRFRLDMLTDFLADYGK